MVASEANHPERPTPDEAGFRQWMGVRSAPLRRKAYLLSGDWHSADDLVQDTLISMYAGWSRIARGRNVDAYANRVLVHKHLDQRRRPWRRERLGLSIPEVPDEGSQHAFGEIESRDDALASALGELPAGQRAVLVLRYTDDLSVDEIARLLDLPSGTVKSRLSRGTESVRRELERQGHPLTLTNATSQTHPPLEGLS